MFIVEYFITGAMLLVLSLTTLWCIYVTTSHYLKWLTEGLVVLPEIKLPEYVDMYWMWCISVLIFMMSSGLGLDQSHCKNGPCDVNVIELPQIVVIGAYVVASYISKPLVIIGVVVGGNILVRRFSRICKKVLKLVGKDND